MIGITAVSGKGRRPPILLPGEGEVSGRMRLYIYNMREGTVYWLFMQGA